MNIIISNQNDEMLSSLNIEVIKKIKGTYSVDDIISMFGNFFYEKMILDITALKEYDNVANLQKLSIGLDTDKLILLLDGSPVTADPNYVSSLISMGIYNFTKNAEGITYLMSHPNTYKDVASMHNMNGASGGLAAVKTSNVRTIGVKNITKSAGASTLIYLMKKELEKNYRVAAVELDKKDFIYFNDRNMISVTRDSYGEEMVKLSANFDIILVDINNSDVANSCSDCIYLIEPSIIKINSLVAKNMGVLKELDNKKVILNKCLLTQKDVGDFEMETGVRIFYSMPPLNDRAPNPVIQDFLAKLNLLTKNDAAGVEMNGQVSSGLFNLFKHKS